MKIVWIKTCIIAVSIFMLGLLVGNLVTGDGDHGSYKEAALEWEDIEGTVNYKYLVPGGDRGLEYFVSMDVPGLGDRLPFEISRIEYKLLEKEDKLDIHCIWDSEDPSYLQFARDEKGRLSIWGQKPIVVVDAGHGGINIGGGSNYLWQEKDMNLKMSLLMRDLLEDAGVQVIMTRTSDEYVSLYDRCEISNYVGADLFISNHINRYNGWANGVELLYSLKSDRDLASNLAYSIASVGSDIWSIRTRRDKKIPSLDYYFIHEHTDMDCYIIEYGFADNDKDTRMISENWELMVENAADTIIDYVGGPDFDTYAMGKDEN